MKPQQQQEQQQKEATITPSSLYSTLGLASHASKAEIRSAYRKLAMKWHPDKCCNGEAAEIQLDFKLKFQEIQEAYAVLSNEKKKVLYDFGLYDPDDDEKDCESLGDFMGEMSALMATTTSSQDEKPATFEDLQGIFTSLFGADAGRKRCDRADQGCSSKSSQTINCNASKICEEGSQNNSNGSSSSSSQPMKRNKINSDTRAAEDDAWYSRFWETV